MKYAFLFLLPIFFTFCQEQSAENGLPEKGIWINNKYPLYLRDTRTARYVQYQIYMTAVEFKPGDSNVWVQFRMREWLPYKPAFLGDGKWLLRKDSSEISIPLELMPKGNAIAVGYEMFYPVAGEQVSDVANNFYADKYYNGEKPIQLKAEGEIIGLDTFVAFKPVIDYLEEPGAGDRIYLKSISGAWTKFGLYVTELNDLEIYRLRKNEFGQKVYHLQRVAKTIRLD